MSPFFLGFSQYSFIDTLFFRGDSKPAWNLRQVCPQRWVTNCFTCKWVGQRVEWQLGLHTYKCEGTHIVWKMALHVNDNGPRVWLRSDWINGYVPTGERACPRVDRGKGGNGLWRVHLPGGIGAAVSVAEVLDGQDVEVLLAAQVQPAPIIQLLLPFIGRINRNHT